MTIGSLLTLNLSLGCTDLALWQPISWYCFFEVTHLSTNLGANTLFQGKILLEKEINLSNYMWIKIYKNMREMYGKQNLEESISYGSS